MAGRLRAWYAALGAFLVERSAMITEIAVSDGMGNDDIVEIHQPPVAGAGGRVMGGGRVTLGPDLGEAYLQSTGENLVQENGKFKSVNGLKVWTRT